MEDQENELLALESILSFDEFKYNDLSGEIKVHPVLKNSPLKVIAHCSNELLSVSHSNNKNIHNIKYLPPLTLHFSYTSDYPCSTPPEYTLSCVWLSRKQINTLCGQLDEIWKQQIGNVVLFEWYQFLQDETLSFLGIDEVFQIDYGHSHQKSATFQAKTTNNESSSVCYLAKNRNRAVQDIRSKSEILPFILNYDQNKRRENFNTSAFTCNICFDNKVGSDCVQFTGCDHVYCKKCLISFFTIHIKEGDVKSLRCPGERCDAQLLPKQIKELVEPSVYERYEKLLLQTTLDTMDDVMYCPLLHCQSPVIVDFESTIAQCPVCSYAFCPFCKLSYHGVTKCRVKSGEIQRLCKEYKTANPDEKQVMEKRYGKKVLVTAIEESQTEEWMKDNAKTCPNCQANIEKIDGCNKMTCFKCRSYFCWLCLRVLDPANPYKHFNSPGTACFNQLFQGADLDEDIAYWI